MAARRRFSFPAAVALAAACHGPSASSGPSSKPSTHPGPLPSPQTGTSAQTSPLPSSQASSIPSAKPAASLEPKLPRLTAAQGIVPLSVPGFGDAVVSLPLGTREARPIVLALHGNFDRPEWQCEVWRGITQGEVFVLCPRGVPRRDVPKSYDRWEWGSLAKTKAEVAAALDALRERYREHVATAPIIFTGFSLGAILGARLIQDPELNVGAAVLTEGGYQGWTLAKARSLKPALRRLLFACGQTECLNAFKYQLEPLFAKAELEAAVVAEVKAGHTYDGAVAAGIQQQWPELLAALNTAGDRSSEMGPRSRPASPQP